MRSAAKLQKERYNAATVDSERLQASRNKYKDDLGKTMKDLKDKGKELSKYKKRLKAGR